MHQQLCGASMRALKHEAVYTVLRARVKGQVAYFALRKVLPPYRVLAQHHALAMLERDSAVATANAWKWSLKWPNIQVADGTVRVVQTRPTRYQRGLPVTKGGLSEVIEHNTVKTRDLWYKLMAEHIAGTDRIKNTGQIRRFFKAVAPLTAAAQRHANEAGQSWSDHVALETQAMNLEDPANDVYYKQAVRTVRQASEVGDHLAAALAPSK